MNVAARCTEPASQSNARGAQHAPPRAPAAYDNAPVVAAYDPATGRLAWGSTGPRDLRGVDSLSPKTLEKDSWKWLFLQPLATPSRR